MKVAAISVVILLLFGGLILYIEIPDDLETEYASGYITINVDESMGSVRITGYAAPFVTYTATPTDGHIFLYWEQSGKIICRTSEITLDVSKDAAVTAIFGLSSQVYRDYSWQCPVSDSVTELMSFRLAVDTGDYLDSISRDIVRRATSAVMVPAWMVDPADAYVVAAADHLSEIASGMTDMQRISVVLSFVQTAIDYKTDLDNYAVSEYWTSPYETLFRQSGDCEDTAVLFCSIAMAMGYDVALIAFDDHMGAAVSLPGAAGKTYTCGGVEYVYCETACDTVYDVGRIYLSYADRTASVTPISGGVA